MQLFKDLKIVLFGAGKEGVKISEALVSNGIVPAYYVDNNPEDEDNNRTFVRGGVYSPDVLHDEDHEKLRIIVTPSNPKFRTEIENCLIKMQLEKCIIQRSEICRFDPNLLDADSSLIDVIIELVLSKGNVYYYIVQKQKLIGAISKNTVLETLLKYDSLDLQQNTLIDALGDSLNKSCKVLRIENIENDIIDFINGGNEINFVPLVDSENNLITVFSANAFTTFDVFSDAQIAEIGFWKRRTKGNDDIIKMQETALAHFNNKVSMHTLFGMPRSLGLTVWEFIKNKSVLEIGCGPTCGVLPYLWSAKERIAIEPLIEQYWDMGCIFTEEIINRKYSIGADVFIPELAGSIDGLIISQNCLDHTPNWPFVLSNIASYAASSSYFHLSTNIYHPYGLDKAHFNLTPNADNMIRIVENFGFKVLKYEVNTPVLQKNLFIKLLAVKL